MNETKFNGVGDLIVGHSEAIINTVEFRGTSLEPPFEVNNMPKTEGTFITVSSTTSPKEAMRFSDDKLRFDLIPPEALIELARVYSMGALKYEDDNWRKGLPYSSSIRAINSHLTLWRSGQAVDSDTGCHHLAQVAWNALTLLVYELTKSGTDDRIKFSIDADFNWVDNHLKLGKTKEEKKQLREKYKQEREKAK